MKPEKILTDDKPNFTPKLGGKENPRQIMGNDPILGLKTKELEVKDKGIYTSEEVGAVKAKASLARIYVILTFIVAFSIFVFSASVNPEVFRLEPNTSQILNQAVNAIVLLVIPFLLGAVGGLTRILITDVAVSQKGTLVISSGLMAMFSWVAIKSDFLFSAVSPMSEIRPAIATVETLEAGNGSGFYSASLVAIVVGMLATSFYLSIVSRVELQLAKANNLHSEVNKDNNENKEN